MKYFISSMKIKKLLLVAFTVLCVAAPLAYSATVNALTCGGAETSIIKCDEDNVDRKLSDNGIWGVLNMAISILTVGVGVAAVGGVVYGSVLYASAGSSTDQTKKAKGIIANVAMGAVAYALMYAVLNFIIPGGVFN